LEEVEEENEVVASTPPEAARPLPMITPASLGCPFPDPNCRFTKTSPVPLRNLQGDINSKLANRNNPNHQSTVTLPVPLCNLQFNIDSGLANQNQTYKTKYEATFLRLQDLEEKYDGLLHLLHRHQAYLLKASSPINLTVGAINLPFVDGHKFDGFDVLKDSEKKQEKKVSAYFTIIMGEVFLWTRSS
jgi:hypothetical protein